MNNRHILLLTITLSIFVLMACGRGNETQAQGETEPIDTLFVPYTYWWPSSGPFINYCGEEYSLVLLGIVNNLGSPVEDSTTYVRQEGVIEIIQSLKTRKLSTDEYRDEKYFSSDCFYQSQLQEKDTVIVFCYEYEGRYNIPGARSIMKINGFDDPVVQSMKKYIESGQDPGSIQKDMDSWVSKGFGSELQQLIECKNAQKIKE